MQTGQVQEKIAAKKLEVFVHTFIELGSVIRASEVRYRSKESIKDARTPELKAKHADLQKAITELREIDHPAFSECLRFFETLDELNPELAEKIVNPNATKYDLLAFATTNEILSPEFDFSDDPHVFENEFYSLMRLLVRQQFIALLGNPTEEREDAVLDLAIIKAKSHAEGMIYRLRAEGIKKSDWAKKTGSVPHKGYVTYEEIRQVAKDMPNGLSVRSKALRVHERLAKEESVKANPRNVHSAEQIRKILAKEAKSQTPQ